MRTPSGDAGAAEERTTNRNNTPLHARIPTLSATALDPKYLTCKRSLVRVQCRPPIPVPSLRRQPRPCGRMTSVVRLPLCEPRASCWCHFQQIAGRPGRWFVASRSSACLRFRPARRKSPFQTPAGPAPSDLAGQTWVARHRSGAVDVDRPRQGMDTGPALGERAPSGCPRAYGRRRACGFSVARRHWGREAPSAQTAVVDLRSVPGPGVDPARRERFGSTRTTPPPGRRDR